MTQYVYKPAVTTSSGAWNGSSMSIFGGICCQFYAKAATATTSFDISLTNADGVVVRKFTDVVHVLNDLTKFPARGVMTVAIANATADEAFDLFFTVEEF